MLRSSARTPVCPSVACVSLHSLYHVSSTVAWLRSTLLCRLFGLQNRWKYPLRTVGNLPQRVHFDDTVFVTGTRDVLHVGHHSLSTSSRLTRFNRCPSPHLLPLHQFSCFLCVPLLDLVSALLQLCFHRAWSFPRHDGAFYLAVMRSRAEHSATFASHLNCTPFENSFSSMHAHEHQVGSLFRHEFHHFLHFSHHHFLFSHLSRGSVPYVCRPPFLWSRPDLWLWGSLLPVAISKSSALVVHVVFPLKILFTLLICHFQYLQRSEVRSHCHQEFIRPRVLSVCHLPLQLAILPLFVRFGIRAGSCFQSRHHAGVISSSSLSSFIFLHGFTLLSVPSFISSVVLALV